MGFRLLLQSRRISFLFSLQFKKGKEEMLSSSSSYSTLLIIGGDGLCRFDFVVRVVLSPFPPLSLLRLEQGFRLWTLSSGESFSVNDI